MLDDRKQTLLQSVIEEYVKTAQPVGSTLIANKYMSELSSPTIRNEMQELGKEGFITQPHTSAGRIPTEAGYRFYIENLGDRDVSAVHQRSLEHAYGRDASHASGGKDERIKSVAKKAAELSQNATVVAFSPNDAYYTGLSNLFSKPEYERHDLVVNMSQVIDHLDKVMSKISQRLDDDISVLLGSDNPFGQECGLVMTLAKGGLVFGILGPMRMDYGQSIGLVRYVKGLIEK